MTDIKILVAAHKKYPMPPDDIYLPIHVGREGKEPIGFRGDNTGDHISSYNPRFCELTAVYWAWKNLDADYIGLVHYRRYFRGKRRGKGLSAAAGRADIEEALSHCDLLLPKPRHYYIETIRSHHIHLPYVYEKDLRILEDEIRMQAPEYLRAFHTVMNRRSAHMFNMFVMKRELFCQFCEWMFPILTETDKRIDTSEYTPMERRAVAYLGEFMLDIWKEKRKLPYAELPVLFLEGDNLLVKGSRALARKLKGGR